MSKDRWLCEVESWKYAYRDEDPNDPAPAKLFYIYGENDGYSRYVIEDYLGSIGKSDWSPDFWNLYDGLLPEDVSTPIPDGFIRICPDYSKPGGRTIYRKYFVKRYGVKAWNRIYGKNFDK
jgi:hypothetical protein